MVEVEASSSATFSYRSQHTTYFFSMGGTVIDKCAKRTRISLIRRRREINIIGQGAKGTKVVIPAK